MKWRGLIPDNRNPLTRFLENLKWHADWWGLASAEEMERDLWVCNYERDGNGRLKP